MKGNLLASPFWCTNLYRPHHVQDSSKQPSKSANRSQVGSLSPKSTQLHKKLELEKSDVGILRKSDGVQMPIRCRSKTTGSCRSMEALIPHGERGLANAEFGDAAEKIPH
ncbi:hypothetical protein VTN96DRAFT_5247 [Rasamsonia emersonii]